MIFKKVARFTVYFLVGILALLLLVQLTFNFYINKKVVSYLQEQVKDASQGRYSLQLESIELSLLHRSLVFNRLKFLPTAACAGCSETQYGATADEIRLEGLGIIAYLKNNAAEAQNVEFSNLSLSVFQGTKTFPAKVKDSIQQTTFSIYKVMSKKLSALTIHNIDINNAKIKMYQSISDTSEIFSSEKNDIEIKNFTINQTVEHLNRLFLADTFNISMKTFSYQLGKGLYTLLGQNLNASYTDSLLTIDSLRLSPNYKKADFGEAAGHQVSRTDLHTAKISFEKMDVKLFIEHNWFIAKKLNINDLYVDVYRDKNIPFKYDKKPSLSLLIRKIPFFISVDSIQLADATIIYEDLEPGAKQAGKISFNRLDGMITGLQNDTTLYTADSRLKLKANAYFMNKGKLDAFYSFDLSTPKEVFQCSGKLGTMQLSDVNNMLENSAHVQVKKGTIDSLVFSFNANDKNSKGTMKFLYHDLDIKLLDKTDKDSDAKHQLLTFLAKQFVIKDQNPAKNKPVRITSINFERDPYRFFFYYTWKSLQSGIVPAIGLPQDFKLKAKK